MLLEIAPHLKPPLQGNHYVSQYQFQMQCYLYLLINKKEKKSQAINIAP